MEPGEAARRWIAGLIIGLAMPFVVLSSLRPIGLLLVALVLVWLAREREVMAAAAGLITGFGSTTLTLFLVANAGCSIPGSCYESSPALPASAAVALFGVALTLVRLRQE